MFAPNRLITVKEQWLLLGIVMAIVAGSITMYLYGHGGDASNEETVLVSRNPTAPVSLKSPEPNRDVAPVRGKPAGGAPAPVSQPPRPGPESPPMPQVESTGEIPLPVEVRSPYQVSSGETGSAPQTIGVAVMGAVSHPGLYMTPSTYRVADLIGLAGGATPAADLSEIMLTAALIDETTLTVPERAVQHIGGQGVSVRRPSNVVLNPAQYVKRVFPLEQETPRAPVQAGNTPGTMNIAVSPVKMSAGETLINVNQATSEQLQQLPGIGPVLASAIIAEREREPFSSVDDLLRVSGIGDKRLSAIRALVTAP